jgi:ElaB/YqjD/DUF883 family membrane-anchored ribosome-binding protein
MNTPTTTHSTDGTLESTRRYAGEALERAGEAVRGLRTDVRGMANKGMHSVSESAHAAQQRLNHYAHATGRYVAEQPVKSALIAAAVGAAVAALVLAIRHNRRSDYF